MQKRSRISLVYRFLTMITLLSIVSNLLAAFDFRYGLVVSLASLFWNILLNLKLIKSEDVQQVEIYKEILKANLSFLLLPPIFSMVGCLLAGLQCSAMSANHSGFFLSGISTWLNIGQICVSYYLNRLSLEIVQSSGQAKYYKTNNIYFLKSLCCCLILLIFYLIFQFQSP